MLLQLLQPFLLLCNIVIALFPSISVSQRFLRDRVYKNFDIKLSGGTLSSEGNVLVSLTDGDPEFLPLCDDNFGMAEANAVCSSFGYSRALRFTRQDGFGEKEYRWSPRDWRDLFELKCSSGDISDCELRRNLQKYCTLAEVAGVVCQDDNFPVPNCPNENFVCEADSFNPDTVCIEESRVCDGLPDCPDGSDETDQLCNRQAIFRLQSLQDHSLPPKSVAGTVYMKYNKTWGNICDDRFDRREAQVICRSLGYEGDFNIPFMAAYFGRGKADIYVDDSECVGTETTISECPFFEWSNTSDCAHNEDAGVFCHSGKIDIRLVDGPTPDSGRVELLSSSISKPMAICDKGFDDLDAQVICRMLGYEGSEAKALRDSPFGRPKGIVWNFVPDCLGDEETITECRGAVLQEKCLTRNTAAVTCRSDESIDEEISELFPSDCGEVVDASNQFISNFAKVRDGVIPSRFDHPWLVNLLIRLRGRYVHNCGGTIISEFFVVSAAHCFEGRGRLHYQVALGDFNAKYDDISQEIYDVEEVYNHEYYLELTTADNDITLLKIKGRDGKGIKFTDRIRPACLPKLRDDYLNLTSCTVSGWGLLGSRTNPERIITFPRTGRTFPVTVETCEAFYSLRLHTSSTACFYPLLSRSNPCAGDSGGPITCLNQDGRRTIYALVSSGDQCTPTNTFPDLNTKITKYLRWIVATVKKDLMRNS